MNYLAHIFLSCHDPYLLVGNFLADFIKQKDVAFLEPSIQLGVTLHKKIDSYTDSHPSVRAAVTLLMPTQKKYAPVTNDILFDYFLIRQWQYFSNENLPIFTDRVYKILNDQKAVFPPRLQQIIPRMIEDDFLMSCKDEEMLKKTFSRVAKRAKFENNFDKATEDLARHHDALNLHFMNFFPDLMQHVGDFCDCNPN